MGLANIGEIADQLVAHGLSAETPVMAINNGTRLSERRMITRLGGAAAAVRRARFEGPVLFIVGDVVRLAAQIETKPAGASDARLEIRV